HKTKPSLKAICHNFTLDFLSEFIERDIKSLIPNIELLIENDTPPEEITFSDSKLELLTEPDCHLIEKYKKSISTRLDIKNLQESDKNEIIKKYKSISVFLKKIKEAK